MRYGHIRWCYFPYLVISWLNTQHQFLLDCRSYLFYKHSKNVKLLLIFIFNCSIYTFWFDFWFPLTTNTLGEFLLFCLLVDTNLPRPLHYYRLLVQCSVHPVHDMSCCSILASRAGAEWSRVREDQCAAWRHSSIDPPVLPTLAHSMKQLFILLYYIRPSRYF